MNRWILCLTADKTDHTMFYVIAAIIAVLAYLAYVGVKQTKNNKRKRIEKLKAQYGNINTRVYDPIELANIAHYYQNHKEGKEIVDDITWNDLNMDTIFSTMNLTQSSAGEEYLYYMLRTPSQKIEEVEEFDSLVTLMDENEEQRLKLQEKFCSIGHTVKLSLSNYIDSFRELEATSKVIDYVCIFLLIASIVTFAIVPQFGVLFLIGVITFNIIKYYSEKAVFDSYFICIAYLVRLAANASEIAKLDGMDPKIRSYLDDLESHAKPLSKIVSKAKLIGTGDRAAGGSPLDMIMDYVRLITHIDLIQFKNSINLVKDHSDDIEALLRIIGYLECTVAVASYRRSLPFYARPAFVNGPELKIDMTDGYHPLLASPVANNIDVSRCVLLTGSNASGKSTFIKTVALCAILSQTIATAPAHAFTTRFYRIYTSMALKDNLQNNESYYMVEIKSLKRILDAKDGENPVLCFVDEVLRGTNTVERVAASSQILENMAQSNILCFAATHDIELTYLLEDTYENYHFKETVTDNDVTFDYVLNKGRATTRNAIRLLKILGYDEKIIESADKTAENYLKTGEWRKM